MSQYTKQYKVSQYTKQYKVSQYTKQYKMSQYNKQYKNPKIPNYTVQGVPEQNMK